VERVNVGRIWAVYVSNMSASFGYNSITEVFNNLKARKKLLLFMANNCLELFLSRQSGFMKLSLKDLCQFVASVTVKIVSAEDLVVADALFGGKSDPYVVVKLGNEKFKTKVKKNTLNPEFDEEVTLP
jgi:Ca2+-dependent lipid-binding protein